MVRERRSDNLSRQGTECRYQMVTQTSRPHRISHPKMDGKSHGRKHSLPDGRWRVAFAFDPRCVAILLVVGNKSGTHERRFYRLERRADLLLSTLASYVAAI